MGRGEERGQWGGGVREELLVGGCGEDEAVGGDLRDAGGEYGCEVVDAAGGGYWDGEG